MSRKLVSTFLAVLLTATPLVLLTSSPASAQTYNVINASVVTTTDLTPFTENPTLQNFWDFMAGQSIAGTTVLGCLNGECDMNVGALAIVGQEGDCVAGTPADEGQVPFCRALGYCVQADIASNILQSPYGAFTFDARATYLAWKYSSSYHGGWNTSGGTANSDFLSNMNGNTAPVFAAAQALIWKWVSDPNGSSVWDGFNTSEAVSDAGTGFTPQENVNPDPTVDVWLLAIGDNLGGAYLYADDPDALMAAANQAIIDLEAEATAKQGPWTVADSADYSGIVITGAVGPIYGETITFGDGSTAVTDANGYVAWPDGVTELDFERPGVTYLGIGNEDSQDIMLAFGEAVNVTKPVVEVIPDPTPTPEEEDPVEEIALTDEEEELPFVGSEKSLFHAAVFFVLAGLGICTTAALLRRD